MADTLQAGVKYSKITDDPEFHALSPGEQMQAMDAVDPEFRSLGPQDKATVLGGITKAWTASRSIPESSNPLVNINKGLTTAGLYAGSVLDPAIKATTFGLVDPQKTQLDALPKIYPHIQTDPGALGQAYRAYQNPYANMAGGALGALRGTNQLGQAIGNWAVPAFSGITNAVNVAKGQMNPLQAIMQTGIDTAAGYLPGGKTLLGRIRNQGAGGALAGAVSSAVGDLTGGKQINWQQAIDEAIKQSILGAAMGAGHHFASHPAAIPVEAPTYQGHKVAQYGPADRLYRGSVAERDQHIVRSNTTKIIQLKNAGNNTDARQHFESLPEPVRAAVQRELEAFQLKNEGRKAVKAQTIKQAAESLGPRAGAKTQAEALKAAILDRHKISPEQKTAQAHQNRVDLENLKTKNREHLTNLQAESKQKPLHAKVLLEQAKQATLQARTTREQARLEYQRAQQLLNVVKKGGDTKALNNAKKLITAAQEKLAQANADLKAKTEAQAKHTEAAKPAPKAEAKPEVKVEPVAEQKKPAIKITGAGRNEKVYDQAIREGKAVEAIHHADKAGTRDESTFERKFDLPYEKGTIKRLVDTNTKRVITNPKNGKPIDGKTKAAQALIESGKAEIRDVPFVRVVNENGKFSMRYLEDIKGQAKISHKEHPYAVVMGEDGRPVAVRNGEVVDQSSDNLTRHSELKAKLETMDGLVEKLKKGESVKASDILEPTKGMSHEDFSDKMKDVPQETIDKMAKDLGCC